MTSFEFVDGTAMCGRQRRSAQRSGAERCFYATKRKAPPSGGLTGRFSVTPTRYHTDANILMRHMSQTTTTNQPTTTTQPNNHPPQTTNERSPSDREDFCYDETRHVHHVTRRAAQRCSTWMSMASGSNTNTRPHDNT